MGENFKLLTSKRVAQMLEHTFVRHFLQSMKTELECFKTGRKDNLNSFAMRGPNGGVSGIVYLSNEYKGGDNAVVWVTEPGKNGHISDGYHTFDELYEFRKLYNAALFNEWGKGEYVYGIALTERPDQVEVLNEPLLRVQYDVHKSWRHHDGELCFGGGWFIVVAMLPTGQISNHYKAEDWDLFKIPEAEKAKYPFDGHTSADVLQRLKSIL